MSVQSITILGNGSWSSALAKILTDNGQSIQWWMRSADALKSLQETGHNPHYLTTVQFDMNLIGLHTDLIQAIHQSDIILVGIPSAFIADVFAILPKDTFKGKVVLSAVKGILPGHSQLLNEYLKDHFDLPTENYCCISGPCHAEEVAADKLSYLTFASDDTKVAASIAALFQSPKLQTIVSNDVNGVQYAAVLKNIYALGAGIAHGLDYGDNFMSVYITNCFAELQRFMDVISTQTQHHYNTSAYLGDLLVTCYSLHSRNRTFGNFIGKGYSVNAAKLELNMVAEGYYASKGIHEISMKYHYPLPIADTIYAILWLNESPAEAFRKIEGIFS
ncbi:MAG: NAD(P)-binding domain-containing protein [Chitinophagaceae bacterium]|nr:NAD(P)-binding domain-containing protein [Chitinophagaceae bacterium]